MTITSGVLGDAVKQPTLGVIPPGGAAACNFVVVYGDPGQGGHHLGILPRRAAETHRDEVTDNTFANLEPTPVFRKGTDTMVFGHVGTVTAMIDKIMVGNVVYLAFFGHGWNAGDGKGGALFVGDGSGPDTNLSNRPGATNTGVSTIPPGKFVASGAQVRLFACRSGFGSGSIAAHLAAHLQVPVFGYDNPNGSVFTNDPDVGHGTREYSKSAKKTVSPGNTLWLVPNDGSPRFKKFS